jgi:hypothetical protein
VVDAGPAPTMRGLVDELGARGIRRLMVEGGGTVLTGFLTEDGLVDELQLAVAPVFVGDGRGRRFVGDGRFPWTGGRRARLLESRSVGDVALLRYALSARCLAPAVDQVDGDGAAGGHAGARPHDGVQRQDREQHERDGAEDQGEQHVVGRETTDHVH